MGSLARRLFAALQEETRNLLDEQGYAAGALADPFDDVPRQGMMGCELTARLRAGSPARPDSCRPPGRGGSARKCAGAAACGSPLPGGRGGSDSSLGTSTTLAD